MDTNNYNTDINVIGSIPDYNLFYRAFQLLAQKEQSLKEILVNKNEFDFRTERSRKRFLSAVNSAFLSFRNKDHEDLVKSVFKECNEVLEIKQLFLFWQFALNNSLFFDITKNVFIKNYFSGKATFPKGDIVAYIKDLITNNMELKVKWSENTINIIAQKYLAFLRKVDLVVGSQKKMFKHIQVSNEALIIFIRLLNITSPTVSNIFDNSYISLSMVSKESFTERVKQLAKKGLLEMNFNGVALNVKPF